MDAKSADSELTAALAELRHIRQAVERARENHPVRLVARPLLTYATVLGLGVIVFGVAAQLVLDYGGGTGLVWGLGGFLFVLAGIAKLAVIDVASRRLGYEITTVLRATWSVDYLRILVPGVLSMVLASLALHRLDGDRMILAWVLAAFGALVVPLAAAISLPEWTLFGVILFGLGAVSMFALTQWPFYMLAACWGGSLVIGGAVLRRRFPEPRDEPDSDRA